MAEVAEVNIIDHLYLCPEPLAEAPGYHSPGVRLDGQHGAETPPKCLPDDETSATGLDERHAEASRTVVFVVLPGPVDGLEAQEAGHHLETGGFEGWSVVTMLHWRRQQTDMKMFLRVGRTHYLVILPGSVTPPHRLDERHGSS